MSDELRDYDSLTELRSDLKKTQRWLKDAIKDGDAERIYDYEIDIIDMEKEIADLEKKVA